VILREAFPERSSLLDEVRLVASLRPIERSFEQTLISNAVRSSIPLNLIGVDCQHLH
jgi:hypothetical protein